jgi:hypothetical protein
VQNDIMDILLNSRVVIRFVNRDLDRRRQKTYKTTPDNFGTMDGVVMRVRRDGELETEYILCSVDFKPLSYQPGFIYFDHSASWNDLGSGDENI